MVRIGVLFAHANDVGPRKLEAELGGAELLRVTGAQTVVRQRRTLDDVLWQGSGELPLLGRGRRRLELGAAGDADEVAPCRRAPAGAASGAEGPCKDAKTSCGHVTKPRPAEMPAAVGWVCRR